MFLNQVQRTTLNSTKWSLLVSKEITVIIERDKEEEKSAREKIIITDKVSNPESFKNSEVILKELNHFCPNIKAVAAFSLARGGISIYLQSVEDRNKILEELPSESFGGGIKKSLNPYKTSRIFLKGVDTCIKEERIESTLKSISSDILAVKRLKTI